MTNTKKILITTESSEVFIVRFHGKSGVRGFCASCAAETDLLTLDEAVTFSGTGTREIVRQVESGEVHSIETSSGHLLICRSALAEFLKGEI